MTNLAGAHVSALLIGLPKGQREAICVAYYGGYTYSQTAELLQQPVGTIKSRNPERIAAPPRATDD